MVCHCNVPSVCPQPDTRILHPATPTHPAKAMTPPQRRQLALEALAGAETVSRLAGQHEVSRKFVYRQAAKAEEALHAAFSPADRDDQKVLFHLPVTKAGLRQLIFGPTLICHSSLRGVVELLRDVFHILQTDFVVAELRCRQPLCPHRIGPVVRALANQRDDLLAFAAQLDQDLAVLAAEFQVAEFQVAVETARAVLDVELLPPDDPSRWPREAALRSQLGSRYFPLSVAMLEVARQTVRASSLVENLNSRLRNYFFLRRHLGPDYLALLQFFLNHRRFLRSERPERAGKSPAELLSGSPHPHWLEMLGYVRFSRN